MIMSLPPKLTASLSCLIKNVSKKKKKDKGGWEEDLVPTVPGGLGLLKSNVFG